MVQKLQNDNLSFPREASAVNQFGQAVKSGGMSGGTSFILVATKADVKLRTY